MTQNQLSSEETHKGLVEFLAQEFARTEGRVCVLLDLSSAPRGGQSTEIHTWDRQESPDLFSGLSNVEQIATDLLRRAEDFARPSGPGSHRFEVRTRQHLGRRNRMAFSVFVEGHALTSAGGVGDDGEMSPTANGLVGQLMRHLEVKERTQTAIFQTTIGTMSRQINDLSEEARALRKERNDQLKELEEARSMQSERDMDGLRQIAADQRKSDLLTELRKLLPVVISRFAGTGAGGAGSAISMLARELGGSFSDEQMAQLGSLLTMQQKMLMAELMRVAQTTGAEPGAGQQAKAATG